MYLQFNFREYPLATIFKRDDISLFLCFRPKISIIDFTPSQNEVFEVLSRIHFGVKRHLNIFLGKTIMFFAGGPNNDLIVFFTHLCMTPKAKCLFQRTKRHRRGGNRPHKCYWLLMKMMMIQIISNPIHNLDWWKINKFPMGSRLTLFSIMFELLSSVMRDQWCCVLLQHRMTTLLREQLGSFESRALDKMVRKSCTIFLLASCFILTSYNKKGHQ